jgi:hypothetical protein
VTAGTVPAQEVREDTGCLVYAVVRNRPSGSLAVQGVDGVPLRLVALGDLAAVVNDIALERPPGRRADLVAYSHAVDDLRSGGVVVPVRYGSVMPDDEAVLEEFLAPNEAYFAELLDQLEGRAQFNVRASYRDKAGLAEIVSTDPEVAELRARTRDLPEEAAYADRVRLGELVAQQMDVKRQFDADALVSAITPLVAAHRLQIGSGLELVCDVNVLVDDDHRAAFEDEMEHLAEAVHERIALRLVGPIAPYDFVGDL